MFTQGFATLMSRFRPDAVLLGGFQPHFGLLLFKAQLLGEGDAVEVLFQVQPPQGGMTVLRHAAGDDGQLPALGLALL